MKTKCWKCHGRGWLYDPVLGFFTLGIGTLIQAFDGHSGGGHHNEICPVCDGKGWLE